MEVRIRRFRAERIPYPREAPSFDPGVLAEGMPLDIEVGCGVGLHPIRYARSHPERYLIAIEHTRIKFEKFATRLSHHDRLPNLLPIHADAVEWITHFIGPSTVDRYFFLYPNPWPRKRDEHRRWYALPFMERVHETMKVGATLHLATNLAEYAEGARRFLTRGWGLKLESERELRRQESDADSFRPRTHFEKKYLERGETCFDLLFRK